MKKRRSPITNQYARLPFMKMGLPLTMENSKITMILKTKSSWRNSMMDTFHLNCARNIPRGSYLSVFLIKQPKSSCLLRLLPTSSSQDRACPFPSQAKRPSSLRKARPVRTSSSNQEEIEKSQQWGCDSRTEVQSQCRPTLTPPSKMSSITSQLSVEYLISSFSEGSLQSHSISHRL